MIPTGTIVEWLAKALLSVNKRIGEHSADRKAALLISTATRELLTLRPDLAEVRAMLAQADRLITAPSIALEKARSLLELVEEGDRRIGSGAGGGEAWGRGGAGGSPGKKKSASKKGGKKKSAPKKGGKKNVPSKAKGTATTGRKKVGRNPTTSAAPRVAGAPRRSKKRTVRRGAAR